MGLGSVGGWQGGLLLLQATVAWRGPPFLFNVFLISPFSKKNKFGKESNLKPKVIIAGDSIVKNVQGWRLSSKKDVKVHSFSGAKIADMNHHIVPLLERQPDEVILHIGTNEIGDSEEENAQIADELIKLTRKVMNANIRCTVSLLTRRDNRFKTQVDRVNDIIRDKLKNITNIKVILIMNR